MIYGYECKDCKTKHDITKPMADCAKEEFCPKCKNTLSRTYKLNSIKTADGINNG